MVIENALEKKSKSVLGAPVGRRFALFVDDVNMPSVEEYGAQPPIELLRQLLDFEGVYDHEKDWSWTNFLDVSMICAGGPRVEAEMNYQCVLCDTLTSFAWQMPKRRCKEFLVSF